jgi:hypothetical protein
MSHASAFALRKIQGKGVGSAALAGGSLSWFRPMRVELDRSSRPGQCHRTEGGMSAARRWQSMEKVVADERERAGRDVCGRSKSLTTPLTSSAGKPAASRPSC